MNQPKPEDPMAWHAQIAEKVEEVKQERACEYNPFAGCYTIPELPSCSCEKGCCDWTDEWCLWYDKWDRVCWPLRCWRVFG